MKPSDLVDATRCQVLPGNATKWLCHLFLGGGASGNSFPGRALERVLSVNQDWQTIEKILATCPQPDTLSTLTDYAGVIQLAVDPLEYQRQIRDEWT